MGAMQTCCHCQKELTIDVGATRGRGSPQAKSGETIAVGSPGLVPQSSGSKEKSGPQEFEMTDEEDKQRLAMMKYTNRRGTVCATSPDANVIINFVKPVFEKNEAAKQRLKDSIKNNDKMQVLCGHLPAAALEDVVNAFAPASFKEAAEVIRQGDAGDRLYIIDEGSVDVFVARPGEDGTIKLGDRGVKVTTLGPGALFGELALLYAAPRAATVVVASAMAQFWALEQEPFKILTMLRAKSQYVLYEGWLREVDLFKALNKYELSKISEAMVSVDYEENEDIVKQGDIGDAFYILEEGDCAAFIQGDAGEVKVKTYDGKGMHFGELALLNDEPRKATIRAGAEGCSALSLSKESFVNLLGPIQDILRSNAHLYPEYAQFLQ